MIDGQSIFWDGVEERGTAVFTTLAYQVNNSVHGKPDKVAPRNKISGIAESNREPIPEVNLIPGNYFWGLA
jgi:hypothetical protein